MCKQPNKPFLRIGTALALLLLLTGLFLLRSRQSAALPKEEILLADAQSREAWLNLCGWRVGAPEVSETCVPSEWKTPAGQCWLRLQHQQGFSPEQYAGSRAVRYVYPAENAATENCRAELLLCGDVLIGAQVYDAETQLMRPVR